ncbi:MAG: BatA and WFA domain-containing protein [bacterium]
MNIQFINPFFLFGLPLVGVPFIIHLMTRKKTRTMAFSDTRLIRLASVKTVRMHHLKQMILLLMRMLAILLVILFFARPIFYALPILPSSQDDASSIVFILDNSYSMGYGVRGQTYFDLAKQILNGLISKLDKKDKAAFLLANKGVVSPVSYLTTDKSAVISEVGKSTLSFSSTDMYEALSKAYTILKDSVSTNKQIVIVGDMAMHGYRNLAELGVSSDLIKTFDEKVKFVFVNIAGKSTSNTFISSLRIGNATVAESVGIKAVISSNGVKTKGDTSISLYVEQASSIKKAQRKVLQDFVSLGRDGNSEKELFYTFGKAGTYEGRVETNRDSIEADDTFYFVAEVDEKINVLLVDGAPGMSFYNNETYFIKLALNPAAGEGNIRSQICTVAELSDKKLRDFSVVVLCNVGDIEKGAEERLYAFLRDGGGLIFFAGDNTTAKIYNSTLVRLLPGTLKQMMSRPGTSYTIDYRNAFSRDSTHTVLEPFSKTKGVALSNASFYNYFLAEPKDTSSVILSFSGGDPYLIEHTLPVKNSGRALLFTSTADKDWNNLPAKPAYVALMQEAVRYASGKSDVIGTKDGLRVGDVIKRDFAPGSAPEYVSVTGPDEKSVLIRPAQKEAGYAISFDGVDIPGIYELGFTYGARMEKEYVAVNLDTQSGESQLEKVSRGQLKKIFAKSPLVVIDDFENLDREFLRLLKGREMSKSLLFLLVGLVMVEGYVANKKNKKEGGA